MASSRPPHVEMVENFASAPMSPTREMIQIADNAADGNLDSLTMTRQLLEIETFRRVELERALSHTMNRLREYKYRYHNLASEHSGCASSYQACYSLVLQNHKWILDHAHDTFRLQMQLEKVQKETDLMVKDRLLPVSAPRENHLFS